VKNKPPGPCPATTVRGTGVLIGRIIQVPLREPRGWSLAPRMHDERRASQAGVVVADELLATPCGLGIVARAQFWQVGAEVLFGLLLVLGSRRDDLGVCDQAVGIDPIAMVGRPLGTSAA
jgi:hypothetical protein